ncbi:cysteine proteinase [Podospora australis]|uniref:Cysteine proteinase n=1 Tax=Podospora australis TaxID=1536484 RepID=A0AAN6X1R4_9PEZI|nr:cysteine proteinase [Podospora australis]
MAAPVPPPVPKKKDYTKAPQELIHEFWDRYFTKKPGKVTRIFPRSLYATLLPPSQPGGARSSRNAADSYEAAAKECREQVQRIIRECRRTNEKFTDPDFDIEWDDDYNCLNGLVRDEDDECSSCHGGEGDQSLESSKPETKGTAAAPGGIQGKKLWKLRSGAASASKKNPGTVEAGPTYYPGSIHRLDWIFESPKWTVDGYSSSDVKQGGNGDCWWLAAVATIAHRKDLMEKICVIRDEEVGVYGFVFFRDGEWISTVVDDNLYLLHEDFDFYGDTYDSTGKRAREYRKRYQTGSEALYFAKCEDPNETWLPLLEKAYAKVHGDYEAISGGIAGEGVEDMTGGTMTSLQTNRVLNKDRLWKELANTDGGFVFSLGAVRTGWDYQKSGLALGHAYSILKATEEVDEDGKKVRLVKIRNPWGQRASSGLGEWNGPWSDGSKEWTPYWFKKLDHKFGDDGVFWMSYQDMLETFMFMDRTRLYDEKWTIVQQWASVNVGWVAGFLNTKFIIDVKKAGTVVVVLSQLDTRYFQGLEGQYTFSLHFILQAEGSDEHICRVRPVTDSDWRSVSCEAELEPGRYEVLPKITARRVDWRDSAEDVVKKWADKNPAKMRQVGMQYDLAHAKGGIPDEDEILSKKKEEEKKKAEEKKRKAKEKAKREKRKQKAEAAAAAATAAAAAAAAATVATQEVLAKAQDSEDKTEEKKDDEKKDKEAKKTEDEKEDEKFEDALEKKDEEKTEEKKNADDKAAAVENVEADKKVQVVPVVEEEESDDDDDESEEEERKRKEEEEAKRLAEDDEGRIPWNAVAVLGLRVYAKDPEISVRLAEPKSEEEAANLVVDSKAAGATM